MVFEVPENREFPDSIYLTLQTAPGYNQAGNGVRGVWQPGSRDGELPAPLSCEGTTRGTALAGVSWFLVQNNYEQPCEGRQ